MAELEMPGEPGRQPPGSSPPPGGELEQQTEHIARLHKMSTTAGIATQEYVAINNTAIASAVLGLATALALQGEIFLVLGIAGLVCGVLAFRQIRDSAGTQGGRGIAVLGILLSLIFGGIGIGKSALESRRQAEHARQINQAIVEVGKVLMAGNYKAAYEMTDPVFQQNHKLDRWETVFKGQAEYFGPLKRFEGNGIVQFTTLAGGTYTGVTMIIAQWESRQVEDARLATYLRQDDSGKWRIYRIIQGFEDQQQRRGGPPGGGPPGGGTPGGAPPAGPTGTTP